jgi:hypothetical protein
MTILGEFVRPLGHQVWTGQGKRNGLGAMALARSLVVGGRGRLKTRKALPGRVDGTASDPPCVLVSMSRRRLYSDPVHRAPLASQQ